MSDRNKRLAISGIFCWLGFLVGAGGADAEIAASLERAGRRVGAGWGDGYHACRDSGFRPRADLPPRSFSQTFGTSPRAGRHRCRAATATATFYDRFDATRQCDCDACDGCEPAPMPVEIGAVSPTAAAARSLPPERLGPWPEPPPDDAGAAPGEMISGSVSLNASASATATPAAIRPAHPGFRVIDRQTRLRTAALGTGFQMPRPEDFWGREPDPADSQTIAIADAADADAVQRHDPIAIEYGPAVRSNPHVLPHAVLELASRPPPPGSNFIRQPR